jgi:hypothetical protein
MDGGVHMKKLLVASCFALSLGVLSSYFVMNLASTDLHSTQTSNSSVAIADPTGPMVVGPIVAIADPTGPMVVGPIVAIADPTGPMVSNQG